jgi:PhnB protein
MTAAKPIPEGYHTLSTYLAVDDASRAIEFYSRAFGAKERMRLPMPDGRIAHAELQIGDSIVMVSDPFPQQACRPPSELGGTTVALCLYVDDVDSFVAQAVNAGATITTPVENAFWGDRFGKLADPFGHEWQVSTHMEDVPPGQIMERARTAMAAMGPG